MRLLTMLCLIALTVLAVPAAVASAAEPLPSILVLSGETTLTSSGTLEGAEVAQFNSALASLQADLVLARLTVPEDMAELGPMEILLEGFTIKGSTTKCRTAGDAGGTLLLDRLEWHLVLILPTDEYGLLVLEPEFIMECENGLKIKIRGSILAKLNTTGETQAVSIEVLCEGTGNRKPKWSEYDLMEPKVAGEMGIAKLETNGGLGWSPACELLTKALSLSTTSMGAEVMEP